MLQGGWDELVRGHLGHSAEGFFPETNSQKHLLEQLLEAQIELWERIHKMVDTFITYNSLQSISNLV